MPYTLAHPAAVLPLRRHCPRLFVWSALVIGATTPDVEYFLKLEPGATYGPTFLGAFTFCVPVGVVLFVLFHGLLKRPMSLLLPRGLRERAWPLASERHAVSLSFVVRVLFSLLVGAWSHQVWDAFTHGYGWGVRALPFLNTVVLRIDTYDLTLSRVVQHGSTFLGATALAVSLVRWYRRAEPRPAPRLGPRRLAPLRLALLVSPVLGAVILAVLRAQDQRGVDLVREVAGALAIGVVSFGALSALAIGAFLTLTGATAEPCSAPARGSESGV